MEWNADKKNLKKGAAIAGGIAALAAFSAVCIKGLKAVDKRLQAKKEAEDFDEDIVVEVEFGEEPAVEEILAEEEAVAEEAAAEEPAAEEPAEEEKPAE